MRRRLAVAWFAAVMLGTLSLKVYAQEEAGTPPTTNTVSAPEPTLRRDMFVSLSVVKELFPAVSRYTSAVHSTPFGKPVATRLQEYTSNDGSQKVSLSVDQYTNPGEALSAYQEADQKSQSDETNSIAISNVGQQVFAYTITKAGGTRIAITSVDGLLVVGATLTGYEATTDNIAMLGDLTRKEVVQASTHINTRRRR